MRAIARYARVGPGLPGLGCDSSPEPDRGHPGVPVGTIGPNFASRNVAVKTLKAGFLVMVLAVAGLSAAPAARAALGADISSIDADRISMKGALTGFSTVKGYAVHEITTAAGVHVREYLTSDGKVFAVSWQGPFIPDLRQMLGTYYASYAQAASAPHVGGHRHLRIERPGLVVESNGRMRAFYGRAWDPALLPPNFIAADIR